MPRRQRPIRVLVIDDDAMSRDLLTLLLEGEGYAVETVESGEDALSLIDTTQAAHDLVLVDQQLPGISGAELAQALRTACGPKTILLAMSGSPPAPAVAALFDGFLLKPFQMEDIAAALRKRTRSKPAAKPAGNTSAGTHTDTSSRSALPARPLAKEIASNRKSGVPMLSETRKADAVKPAPAPILDENIFGQLSRTMLPSQLQEMYTLCIGDARQRIALMRRLAAEEDSGRFIREAHAIKGGSGMLGATELHRQAAELESRGLAGGPRGDEREVNSLDELSAACDRLERMLGSRL